MANSNPNKNIWDVDSTGAYVLIDYRQGRGNLSTIHIVNQHSSNATTFDLYLDDGLGNDNSKVYIAANYSAAASAIVKLDNVSFDNDIYKLVFETSSITGPISIIAR